MAEYDIAGKRYRFDEGISFPGAVDMLVSDGTISPEQGATIFLGEGEELPKTETGGLSPFLPSEEGSASAAQAIGLGHRMAQIGFGDDLGAPEGVQRDQPIATGFGRGLPMFAAGPSITGAALVGGGLESMAQGDRFLNDPAGAAIAAGLEGGKQAAATMGGRIGGEVLGRVTNAVAAAGRNTFNSLRSGVDGLTLPSGIRSTLGKITGNRQIQQAEASLARNPITSRKFAAADRQNEQVIRDKVLSWLGKPPGTKLESAMADTVTESIAKMDEGIPNNVRVSIPEPLQKLFNRLNKVTSEAFDFPGAGKLGGAGEIDGTSLRSVISDLRKGTVSTSATVRQRSRQALNELDKVIQSTDGIDQEAWREGSKLYGRWERLSRPGVISRADPEKVNPTAMFRALEKGNKVATRTRGNVSSGDELTDDLLTTARDLEQVGSLTPDSGTPAGLAVPIVAADLIATGGAGTLGAFAAAEAVESPIGLGIAEGLTTAAPKAGRAGAVAARELVETIFPEEDEL